MLRALIIFWINSKKYKKSRYENPGDIISGEWPSWTSWKRKTGFELVICKL